MGYYIQGPLHGKAEILVDKHGGEIVDIPASFEDIPEDKALICVMDNGAFEAAGLVYSTGEFEEFTLSSDFRPKKFVLMDKETAWQMSGYNPDPNPYVPE